MQLFRGEYEYAVDERGRVPVPPRYREAFAHGAVLAHGAPLRCLRLFTPDGFERLAALHTSAPAIQQSGLIARHALFPRSFEVELDRQGRILIPQRLRSYAALEGTAVVAGNGDWLEIWQPEQFEARMALVEEQWQRMVEPQEQEP